jgi:GNAT superfamily N-acetyltransferase
LSAQAGGLLVQVIAWRGGLPVGAAMVLFPGHDEWSISAHRERCAEVRAVEVRKEARRRGIATRLMAFLEDETRRRGLARIGLTVSLDEDAAPARALYDKLGYTFAHGPFVAGSNLDTDAGPVAVLVVARYLVKTLSDVGTIAEPMRAPVRGKRPTVR